MGIDLSPVAPPPSSRTSSFILNTRLLDDEDLYSALAFIRLFNKRDRSQLSNIDAWNANIKTWTTLCQTVAKKRAEDARRVERLLQEELCKAEMNLQNSPNDGKLTCSLMTIKDHLRAIQNRKIKGLKTKSKLNWPDSGDKGSKFFFHMLKVKEAKESITDIWDNNTHIIDS